MGRYKILEFSKILVVSAILGLKRRALRTARLQALADSAFSALMPRLDTAWIRMAAASRPRSGILAATEAAKP